MTCSYCIKTCDYKGKHFYCINVCTNSQKYEKNILKRQDNHNGYPALKYLMQMFVITEPAR